MADSLYEKLSQELPFQLPMHMPGHKRNVQLAPYLRGLRADIDITEISGFDNLHEAEGILKQGMETAAKLWGAYQSFYLVNGSTGGILAGVSALSDRGDQVIMQRSCHLSVYHAVALCGLQPVYLYNNSLNRYDIQSSLAAESLRICLDEHPEARLLIVCSPSYEGVLSDLDSLVSLAHQRGVKVLVDAAHGAHLGLHASFAQGALASKADIVVHSLHKTLPSLTQTALAHAADAESAAALSQQLDIFQTSSPSYLLMASIDGCIRLLQREGQALMATWWDALDIFYQAMKGLVYLQILGLNGLPDSVWAHDRSKIIILTQNSSMSGFELAQKLKLAYHIEIEMAAEFFVLAQTGLGDTQGNLQKLADALFDIDKTLTAGQNFCFTPLSEAKIIYQAQGALRRPYRLTELEEAAGRICAEYVVLYPPGIPLLVPGEIIQPEIIQRLQGGGAQQRSKSKEDKSRIAILKD